MKRRNYETFYLGRGTPRSRVTIFASSSSEDEEVYDIAPVAVEGLGASSSRAANTADRPVAVWLDDPDVLDCYICCEHLTIPVFQCENGHTACSSCCVKIQNQCPSCSLTMGIRNRLIEKVLESAIKACQNQKHGCREKITYSNKNEHDKACKYKLCTCPFASCTFASSSEQLSLHFTAEHPGSVLRFPLGNRFRVKLGADTQVLVLQEEKGNDLFVLHRREERLGSVIWLGRLSPDSSKEVTFDVVALGKLRQTISMCSIRMCSVGQAHDNSGLPQEGFFLIPSGFFCTGAEFAFDLKMNLSVLYL